MSFRANESAKEGRESAFDYLLGRNIDPEQREESTEKLWQIIDQHGPVVDGYPSWHPLVATGNVKKKAWTGPEENRCYQFLDHTIYLRNAFITCPYNVKTANSILKSVESLPYSPDATISAEILDFQLYNSMATPVLVKCEWNEPMNTDGTIPRRIAVPMMLEFESQNWRNAEVAETWKTMQPYILGCPYGSRSSLFVDQECGQYLKKMYNTMINSGMYGPIYVG